MKNIKKFLIITFMLLVSLMFAGCSNENDKETFKINVYDIDSTLLVSKEIELTEGLTAFDALKNNFNVLYQDSDYGPYLQSINGSIQDPNYYLAIYENGEMAATGVDGLVLDNNDVFDFKVTCWQSFDETDLLVDKVIYSFFKKGLNELLKNNQVDYNLISAINLMKNNYYDASIFNFNFENDYYLNEAKKDYTNETSIGTLFKASIYANAYEYTNDTIKTALEKIVDTKNILNIYTIGYYLIACDNVSSNNSIYTIAKPLLKTIIDGAEASDSLLTTISIYPKHAQEIENDQTVNDALSLFTPLLKENGVEDSWSGVNACSTAQMILALSANNINSRTYNQYDLIKILLSYETENGLFKWQQTSNEADLAFTTPQVISALLMYKLYRDTGKAAPLF